MIFGFCLNCRPIPFWSLDPIPICLKRLEAPKRLIKEFRPLAKHPKGELKYLKQSMYARVPFLLEQSVILFRAFYSEMLEYLGGLRETILRSVPFLNLLSPVGGQMSNKASLSLLMVTSVCSQRLCTHSMVMYGSTTAVATCGHGPTVNLSLNFSP